MDLVQAARAHRLSIVEAVVAILLFRLGTPMLVLGSIWLAIQGVRALRRRTLAHAT